MLGLTEYLAGGAVLVAVGVAGASRYEAVSLRADLEARAVSEAQARGALQTCAARVTNLQEAMASNASIPDDLADFDIPAEWMLGPAADSFAAD